MTINNKTLTTVENLVTNPTTTEGNFRIGLGDALIELNSINEKPPHLHTAVSGTTVNLDVSSYNYFDSGITTADTSINFTNVPVKSRWSYSYRSSLLSGAWGIDSSNVSLRYSRSYARENIVMEDIFISSDGLNLYTITSGDEAVYQYELTTAWDFKTINFVREKNIAGTFSGGGFSNATSLFFKPDGTKMYAACSSFNVVTEYNLGTAWNISTLVYVQNININLRAEFVQSIFFKPDGFKMYVLDSNSDRIKEYSLAVAWDISNLTYNGQSVTFTSGGSAESNPRGLTFNSDGTKYYVTGTTERSIIEYTLYTAWDVSGTDIESGSQYYTNKFFTTTNSWNYGLIFKPDGRKIFTLNGNFRTLDEYTLGLGTKTIFPSSLVGIPKPPGVNKRVTYNFETSDGGTTVNLLSENIIDLD